jgi:hypothetical protein
MYDGNVIQFEQDGDVNVVKAGGLKINNEEVATKEYTDTTFAALDQTESYGITLNSHSTSISDHGDRITTLEGAGYATTSQLSTYATATSLGDTNTTVGGINTRVNSLETAGYITTPSLQAYAYATTGQLADYALSASVPSTTDILNNTNMGATATSGANAGVTVANKASPASYRCGFQLYYSCWCCWSNPDHRSWIYNDRERWNKRIGLSFHSGDNYYFQFYYS